jgi:hypothetical protein
MSERAAKIRRIIESREPIRKRTQKAHAALGDLERQMSDFRGCLATYLSQTCIKDDIRNQQSALDSEIGTLMGDLGGEMANLNRLDARFGRATVNIGVAGYAGMGKSTLLQSITELSDKEIPAGRAGGHHYTGAPSMIINVPGIEPYADLELHSKQSFLQDVIAPYFPALRVARALPDDIGTPQSLDEFRRSDLSKDPPQEANATGLEQLKKLRDVQRHLSEFERDLTGTTKRVNASDIAFYVAQRHPEDPEKQLHHWHAVRLARIYCPFPHKDVGEVSVADTPGLGDFICDAEQRLARTVGENLDVVVFLRMPSLMGRPGEPSPEDTRLYDIMSGAVPDLRLADWSYFLLNHDQSQSKTNCDAYEKVLSDEKCPVKVRSIHRVDCTNPEDVWKCLDLILDDMAEHLGNLDQTLADRRSEAIARIVQRLGDWNVDND